LREVGISAPIALVHGIEEVASARPCPIEYVMDDSAGWFEQAPLVKEWSSLSIDSFLEEPINLDQLQAFIDSTRQSHAMPQATKDLQTLQEMFVGVLSDDRPANHVLSSLLNRLKIRHQIYASDALYELVYSEYDLILMNGELEHLPCDEALRLIQKWSLHVGSKVPPVVLMRGGGSSTGGTSPENGAATDTAPPARARQQPTLYPSRERRRPHCCGTLYCTVPTLSDTAHY